RRLQAGISPELIGRAPEPALDRTVRGHARFPLTICHRSLSFAPAHNPSSSIATTQALSVTSCHPERSEGSDSHRTQKLATSQCPSLEVFVPPSAGQGGIATLRCLRLARVGSFAALRMTRLLRSGCCGGTRAGSNGRLAGS